MSLLRSGGKKASGRRSLLSRMDRSADCTKKNGVIGKNGSSLGNLSTPLCDDVFMSVRQQDYFREKLEKWRADILRQSRETINQLQCEDLNLPDMTDRASSESDWSLELRTRDRQRKLIVKIDAALVRLDEGTYGYCEETGDPIGFRRLDARPIATLSVEAQERHERREKIYRDE